MARPLRLAVADGIHHVFTRGIARAAIVHDDVDRAYFVDVLRLVVERFGWRCLTYCLMQNHVHLLVRTPEPNLPRGMQQLKTRYAQGFNRRHDRVGPLFGGRYGAKLVQTDAYLFELFRYIALNPVKAQVSSDPTGYEWGAHGALAGVTAPPAFLQVEEVWRWFAPGVGGDQGRRRYLDFVAEEHDLTWSPGRGAALGTEGFLRAVLPATSPGREIPTHDWAGGRPSLDELIPGPATPELIARAHRTYRYTLTTIAAHIGCHVSTASRWLRAYERDVVDCKT